MTKLELATLLPLIVKAKDFVIISDTQALLIGKADMNGELMHIERVDNTVNWLGETIPNCREGEARLWALIDWQTTENKRNEVIEASRIERERVNAAYELHQSLKLTVVNYFTTKLHMPLVMVEQAIVKDLNNSQLQELINGIKKTGIEI